MSRRLPLNGGRKPPLLPHHSSTRWRAQAPRPATHLISISGFRPRRLSPFSSKPPRECSMPTSTASSTATSSRRISSWIRPGHAYVTDFGLARDMAQNSKLTCLGEVMGTPAYMSPEQVRGQKELIGEATDVHALGVILYEMLTGQLPYGSGAPADVIVRLMSDEPTPPRKIDRRSAQSRDDLPQGDGQIARPTLCECESVPGDIRRFESGEPVLRGGPARCSRSTAGAASLEDRRRGIGAPRSCYWHSPRGCSTSRSKS